MKSAERINAAISMEIPDKVPVCPLLDHYAATYSGITNAELMADGEKRINAILKTAKELGPWDMTFVADTVHPTMLRLGMPMKLLLPGKELPATEIHQLLEKENFSIEDYDNINKYGVIKFLGHMVKRNYPDMNAIKIAREFLAYIRELRKHRKRVENAGMVMACGAMHTVSFELFSFGRSIGPMAGDIFKHPDKIKSARDVWKKTATRTAKFSAKFVGAPRVFFGLARSSAAMISPRHFEELVLPELEYSVNELINAGITPIFHCDMNWTRHFPFFKRLPAKKCILMLDGTSDIFKAKEILGGHMCIMGDVPSVLTAMGTKDEVLAYCKRLIENVGKNGGFILSTGCSIPNNAKAENIRALAEAVDEWGQY